MHTRNTILMAVVFVLLSGFVYFYEIRGRAEREDAERRAELFLDFEPEQVARLTIESGGERVVATRRDTGWAILEPVEADADADTLDTLVDNLYRATHERLVSEAVEDLEPFGLAEPETRIVVTLEDGSEQELRVGKDTPVGVNLYATTGDGSVYSAPRALRGQATKTLLDLRDRSVLDFDNSAVRGLRISGSELTAELAYDPVADPGGKWALIAPLQVSADSETVEDILADLRDAEASSFVRDDRPDAAALAEYGLDTPWMEIGIGTGDDTWIALRVGDRSEDPPGRFAIRENGTSVFVIPDETLAGVPTTVEGLRNRQVLAVARERIRALELEIDAATVRVEREETGTSWQVVAPRRFVADSAVISRLLSALQDLRAESFGDSAGGPATRLSVETAPDAEGEGARRLDLTLGATRRSMKSLSAADDDSEPIEVRSVTVAGDSTVYWVDAEDVAGLEVDLFEIRDKTLVEFTQGDLTSLQVSGNDGSAWVLTQSDGVWSAEGAPDLDSSTVDDLLWELNYLRMESVATEGVPDDRSAWGLAAPRYRIVAHVDDSVVAEVEIGSTADTAPDDGEQIFVRVTGQDGIFTVGASLADAVAALVEELQP